MKYLITGANGQLGRELQDKLKLKNANFLALDRLSLDITNLESINKIVNEFSPEVIINCAAYTAVDIAESDTQSCYKINRDGVYNLALAAKNIGAKLVHISTDYIFDGNTGDLITEDCVPNPLNVYGKSKFEGEVAINQVLKDNSLIIRTSSVHGQYGNNFVKTMIKLFHEKEELNVVNDQIMSPTYAGFLADTILELIERNAIGVYNVANRGAISWYEFTLQIREFLAKYNSELFKVNILPCSSDKFPRPAKRPKFSAFNLNKTEEFLGHPLMLWQDGLKFHLKDLKYMVE